ncbi:hypothetical protein [Streptomyces sp. NPDC005283]|uniref:hypothetical protein n=1 Tax=Streptomyces sp. NPDC005283 TaxID=3156871 RepID=UPI0034569E21
MARAPGQVLRRGALTDHLAQMERGDLQQRHRFAGRRRRTAAGGSADRGDPVVERGPEVRVVDLPVAGVPEVAHEADVDDESEQHRGEDAERGAEDAQSGAGGRAAR